MPNLTTGELQALRQWRTYLLSASAFLAGLQYALRPTLPLTATAYTALRPIGETGWTVLGAALMAVAAWLAFAPRRITWAAFYAGAVLLVALVVANVVSHVIPGWLILPAGLCLGEVRAHAWQVMRGER